jgi:hypothetical protein
MELADLSARHQRRMRTGKLGLWLVGAVISLPLVWMGISEMLREPNVPPCASYENAHDCETRQRLDALMDRPSLAKAGMMIATGVIMLGAVGMLVRSMSKNTATTLVLLAHPERIGWIYGIEQTTNGLLTARPVMMHGLDGTSSRLAAGSQRDVMAALVRANPQIVVGYDREQAREFAANAAAYRARG